MAAIVSLSSWCQCTKSRANERPRYSTRDRYWKYASHTCASKNIFTSSDTGVRRFRWGRSKERSHLPQDFSLVCSRLRSPQKGRSTTHLRWFLETEQFYKKKCLALTKCLVSDSKSLLSQFLYNIRPAWRFLAGCKFEGIYRINLFHHSLRTLWIYCHAIRISWLPCYVWTIHASYSDELQIVHRKTTGWHTHFFPDRRGTSEARRFNSRTIVSFWIHFAIKKVRLVSTECDVPRIRRFKQRNSSWSGEGLSNTQPSKSNNNHRVGMFSKRNWISLIVRLSFRDDSVAFYTILRKVPHDPVLAFSSKTFIPKP